MGSFFFNRTKVDNFLDFPNIQKTMPRIRVKSDTTLSKNEGLDSIGNLFTESGNDDGTYI